MAAGVQGFEPRLKASKATYFRFLLKAGRTYYQFLFVFNKFKISWPNSNIFRF
jgi:hypothetical protein